MEHNSLCAVLLIIFSLFFITLSILARVIEPFIPSFACKNVETLNFKVLSNSHFRVWTAFNCDVI